MTAPAPLHDVPAFHLDPYARDPYGEARRLRRFGYPVCPIVMPGGVDMPHGVRAWTVCGFDLAAEVLSDEVYPLSKELTNWRARREGEIPESCAVLPLVMGGEFLFLDDPQHARLRVMVDAAFARARVGRMNGHHQAHARRLVDQLPVDRAVDLREEYAYPLPVSVICTMLGMDDLQQREILRSAYLQKLGSLNTGTDIQQVSDTITEQLDALIEAKTRTPGEDLTSELIRARDGADRLSRRELIDTISLLIAAGHETTVNLIVNGAATLIRHPGQLELLLEMPGKWPNAISEIARYASPVLHALMRYATADFDLGGTLIRRGDPVVVSIAAACLDPARFGPTADTFDITRYPRPGLAFGRGVHQCLGEDLGRQMAATALQTLFTRYPEADLAVLAEELDRIPSIAIQGYRGLPLQLHPR